MKIAKIYISYVSTKSMSVAGCVVFNPTTNQICKFVTVAKDNETYLAALIKGACCALVTLDESCDIEIICDYNGLHSSIYKHSKYKELNDAFKKLAELHNSVSILYGRANEQRWLKEAKELAKADLYKTRLNSEAEAKPEISCDSDFIPDFIVYTDGSCNNFSLFGEGGAAYVLLDGNGENVIKCHSKGILGTTNNRAEMIAILSALRAIPDGTSIIIKTDSQYCIDALTGKKTRFCRGVLNQDIIAMFKQEAQRLSRIAFEWVKGHNGNYYNEMADELAEARREEIREIYRIPVYTYKDYAKRGMTKAERERDRKFREWMSDNPDSIKYHDTVPF